MTENSIASFVNNIVFLDFEASSLYGPKLFDPILSWPIEVGIAWFSDDWTVLSESRLIKPHKNWDMRGWNEESAAIHGIHLDDIKENGIEVNEAASWVKSFFPGKTPFAGNEFWDNYWMNCLVKPSNPLIQSKDSVYLRDLVDLLMMCSDDIVVNFMEEYKFPPAPHRAAADAEIMLQACKDIMEMEPDRYPQLRF